MEVLHEAPKPSSFIPLAEHQSATPVSFYDGPPVLHYYSDRCKLIILEHEANGVPALVNLVSKAPTSTTSDVSPHINGASQARKVIEDVDVWVTSDKLFIFSTGLNTGLSITYPSISLHAIQSQPEPSAIDTASQGLYMQLVSSAEDTLMQSEDEEPESISVTIVPTASLPPTASAPPGAVDVELASEGQPETSPVAAMFAALSECSNLHPDPVDDDEDGEDGYDGGGSGIAGSRLYQGGMIMPGGVDGGLPPPMPGSGGWITAENMHEFLDEEGNWIGPEDDGGSVDVMDGLEEGSLGPGAGTTRQRDEGGRDGVDDDETKWRRTE